MRDREHRALPLTFSRRRVPFTARPTGEPPDIVQWVQPVVWTEQLQSEHYDLAQDVKE
jgi:hypothetical protein